MQTKNANSNTQENYSNGFFIWKTKMIHFKVLVFADHQTIKDDLRIIIDNHEPVFLDIEVLQ